MFILQKPSFSITKGKHYWGNLPSASLSLAIAEAIQNTKRFTLILTENNESRESLKEQLVFFNPQISLLEFPDRETLPYDISSPPQEIISQRINTLSKLPYLNDGVLVLAITTALDRLPPTKFILSRSFSISIGDNLNINKIRMKLESNGYISVHTVYNNGEFAVRGCLIDLFPIGSKVPYRIDLFSEEVESIYTFIPKTQRSTNSIKKISLLPRREFPINEESFSLFKERFCKRFRIGNISNIPLLDDLNKGIFSSGIESYMPLFFEETASFFDYLPSDTEVFLSPGVYKSAERFWFDLKKRYTECHIDRVSPSLKPNELFISVEEFFRYKEDVTFLVNVHSHWNIDKCLNFPVAQLPELKSYSSSTNSLPKLKEFLQEFNGRVLFTASSKVRYEMLLDLLSRAGIFPKYVESWNEFLSKKYLSNIIIGPFSEGLLFESPSIALIPENQLLNGIPKSIENNYNCTPIEINNPFLTELTEISEGSAVVHIEHGIGRYKGLTTLEINNQVADFLTLEYAQEAKLYVPIDKLHLIRNYTSVDGEQPPLHRLGSTAWKKTKNKAEKKVRDVAIELLDIYSKRSSEKGNIFKDPKNDYKVFSAGFPYEETPDQKKAIDAVYKDMLSSKIMDRLVCGDVGFGKTEVAIRATFIAVYGGFQVGVLVPTTLLAQQHYNSFRDRFSEWPFQIEVISRFQSKEEIRNILVKLKMGKIDILIGTHALLQKQVIFKKIGLIIIDEEHRFGVLQKENFKSFRSKVDVLTLTATPIPRTLNMAISGIRDLSIISTPPKRRLSVKTFVSKKDDKIIRDAISREISRGGQSYYLYNQVKSIEKCAQYLSVLVPEARIGIAHGQMKEEKLEQVIRDFYQKRFNLLVTSNIVETGIDIPSVNTIIIERADKFGLAQLHQLRGRVGRSHHQAYAYLLRPAYNDVSINAKRRLEAIVTNQDLSSGFSLATNDLEIRGAGEILGDNQSGDIYAIGLSLYIEMLSHAVKSLNAGGDTNNSSLLDELPEISLRVPSLIPEKYLPDIPTRLYFYNKICLAKNKTTLEETQEELIDKFGPVPELVKNLLKTRLIKIRAEELGIKKINLTEKGGEIEFRSKTVVSPLHLVKIVTDNPSLYKLCNGSVLKFIFPMKNMSERFKVIENFFKLFED